VALALVFLFASVIQGLARDWWTDENYSHGLLVPIVIALIIYLEFNELRKARASSAVFLGGAMIGLGLIGLLFGTLGAELFTQRIALLTVLVGTIVYFFGTEILKLLIVPFLLLLFSIPIPQIVFNKIAFPLQIFASRVSVVVISLFDIPTVRKGNVIEMLPRGAAQIVSLEVVEACSGIRSLMTLATLALVLAYFSRTKKCKANSRWRDCLFSKDALRGLLLVLSAIPIAIITNAGRVAATGIATFYYGRQMADGVAHALSGWLVYLIALVMLFLVNTILKFFLRESKTETPSKPETKLIPFLTTSRVFAIVICFLISGLAINWLARRGEVFAERKPLRELSTSLGDWKQQGSDSRFSEETESVLRASDYVMRDYVSPQGFSANLYVGYYDTQRTGATYHSPQNCLPGAGWEMVEPKRVTISDSAGKSFEVNRFIIQNGDRREILIYWYQGRGRKTASEFSDKYNTVIDSLLRRRSDGAMIRIMTPVHSSVAESEDFAIDLAQQVSDQLIPFLPD